MLGFGVEGLGSQVVVSDTTVFGIVYVAVSDTCIAVAYVAV